MVSHRSQVMDARFASLNTKPWRAVSGPANGSIRLLDMGQWLSMGSLQQQTHRINRLVLSQYAEVLFAAAGPTVVAYDYLVAPDVERQVTFGDTIIMWKSLTDLIDNGAGLLRRSMMACSGCMMSDILLVWLFQSMPYWLQMLPLLPRQKARPSQSREQIIHLIFICFDDLLSLTHAFKHTAYRHMHIHTHKKNGKIPLLLTMSLLPFTHVLKLRLFRQAVLGWPSV